MRYQNVIFPMFVGSFLALPSAGQFVTLEGRQFMLNGAEFFPVVMNFHIKYVRQGYDNGGFPASAFYLAPEASFGPTLTFDCLGETGPSGCTERLRLDFQKVVEMGFNTVRLVGDITPQYTDTPDLGSDERRFKLDIGQNPFPNNDHDGNRRRINLEDDLNGLYTERHFNLLRDLLDLADEEGLKVILLTGGPVKDWHPNQLPARYMYPAFDQKAIDAYSTYLARLATELNSHPALLAFDIFNEPHYNMMQFQGAWNNTVPNWPKWTKEDICTISGDWFQAIKSGDPELLVTLGGLGAAELEQWDMAALHLDFYSLHLYPNTDYRRQWDIDQGLSYFENELYWFGKTCPMPWIIGETGFSANDHSGTQYLPQVGVEPIYHEWPYMEGDEQDQAEFVAMSLEKTRMNGGSGWSWWYFQEMRWWTLYYPNDAYLYPGNMRGIYYALLHLGDQTQDYYDKVAVQTVRDFDPDLPIAPNNPLPNYFNWDNLPGPVSFSGTVVDQNSMPIENAQAWLRLTSQFNILDPPIPLITEDSTTFHPATTNQSGYFYINTVTPPAHYLQAHPSNLIVSAVGTTILGMGSWFPSPNIDNNSQYPLYKNVFEFDEQVENLNLLGSVGNNLISYEGWDHLTISDVTVLPWDGPNELDFVARQTVHVENEFLVAQGNEVHLYTNETFPDCDDTSYVQMQIIQEQSNDQPYEKARNVEATIVLKFDQEVKRSSVFPNPFTNEIQVLFGNPDGTKLLELFDGLGRNILYWRTIGLTESLFLGQIAPGPYRLKISNGSTIEHFSLIKQP